MCGIAGIIDFEGRPIQRRLLNDACASLAHRGPDDRGIWVHESDGWSAGLAHTRLAVIDPAPEAHQPMIVPQGPWAIAYNGELYNYRALSRHLAEAPTTSSDTEVFLQSCRQRGPSALQQFDGMWAAAVLDVCGRCGHLSRDPVGIKPLYYAVADHRLTFASELTTLLHLTGGSPQVDAEAVASFLQLGFIPHPLTIYRHIYKLPPGHVLHFHADGPRQPEPYFRLSPPPAQPPSYAEACEQLRGRIEAAVVRQCVSDVPLGAFLSGGLDSSVVVACMTQRGGPPVQTFSIGYADHPRYDETEYARRVARHLGTQHHEFRLTFGDVLGAVEPMLNHLGEPFADSSLLPTSLVSRHTRQHVTVALSGDGGDELFGGYWRYLGHHYLERYRRIPTLLRRGLIEPLLRRIAEARTTPRLDRLRQVRKLLRGDCDDPLDRHLAWTTFMEPDLAAAMLGALRATATSTWLRRQYVQAAAQWQETPGTESPLQRILLADMGVSLPGDMLFKVDTASMYHALEVRVPLLSTDVIEYAANLPLTYKIQGTTGKRILRDAFRDLLPPEVFQRRKMGFEVPVGEFLRHELQDMYLSTVTSDALASFGIDVKVAADLYQQHLTRRRDRTELLWSLLVLCWWQQKRAPNLAVSVWADGPTMGR